jgi:hypothetical protein
MRARCLFVRWPVLVLAGVVVLTGVRGLVAETPSGTAASEARLRRDVTFLASDACEGRGVTTEGIRKAADYIAGEFRKAGLKPGGVDDTYFQPFTIPGAVLEAPATLSLHGPGGRVVSCKEGTDFYPMGLGHAGAVKGLPAVFAGFGISSDSDPEYDDYTDLDVADKVVFVLRDAPAGLASGEKRQRLASFSSKIATAEKLHAAALIVVNDSPGAADGDDLLDFNFTALAASHAGIPVLHAHRSVLEAMLPRGVGSLSDIENSIVHNLKPRGLALEGWSVSLSVKMKRDKVALKNVIGVLEGSGPLAQETVVIGAHYDHLGYGGPFSTGSASLAKLKKMAIHHGADDNGSGTTSVLELARRLAAAPPANRRRLVFMTFSGEEINLLGSAHYAKNPVFPLADTVAMVNLDMVGRPRPDEETKKNRLLIEGSGTAKTFDALLEEVNKKYDFKLIKKPGGVGPSDHTSFYLKQVPVIFCWTGLHADYHRPSDTADKIDVPGMRKVVDFTEDVITRLETVEKRPEYVAIKTTDTARGSVPRLGIRPSYDDTDEDHGLLLDGVTPEGPAHRAGLKAGDRIVEVAGKPVRNIESYMSVMVGQKKTGTLDLVIFRDGKRMPVKIHLD